MAIFRQIWQRWRGVGEGRRRNKPPITWPNSSDQRRDVEGGGGLGGRWGKAWHASCIEAATRVATERSEQSAGWSAGCLPARLPVTRSFYTVARKNDDSPTKIRGSVTTTTDSSTYTRVWVFYFMRN